MKPVKERIKKGPNAQAFAHANPKASFLRKKKKKASPNAQAIAHANPKASFLKKKKKGIGSIVKGIAKGAAMGAGLAAGARAVRGRKGTLKIDPKAIRASKPTKKGFNEKKYKKAHKKHFGL